MKRTAFAVLIGMLWTAAAAAQSYPSRMIRLVVPFPAGGVTDIMARAVATGLEQRLGQPVVVENRAGASGSVGADAVAKSPPDGYTLLLGNISTLAVNTATFAKLPYDPVKSFAPISLIAVQPLVVAVHPSIPATSLEGLVALAKTKPGGLTYGSAGSSIQLAVESFSAIAGIKMKHVPYKGSAQAVIDLTGGHIDVLFDPISTLGPLAKSGAVRGLAVTTLKRSPAAPELPTLAESGYPGFDVSSWQGMVAPAGTPPEIVERLHREIAAVLALLETREKLAPQGAEPTSSTPHEFGAYIAKEVARWQEVARAAGIAPE